MTKNELQAIASVVTGIADEDIRATVIEGIMGTLGSENDRKLFVDACDLPRLYIGMVQRYDGKELGAVQYFVADLPPTYILQQLQVQAQLQYGEEYTIGQWEEETHVQEWNEKRPDDMIYACRAKAICKCNDRCWINLQVTVIEPSFFPGG